MGGILTWPFAGVGGGNSKKRYPWQKAEGDKLLGKKGLLDDPNANGTVTGQPAGTSIYDDAQPTSPAPTAPGPGGGGGGGSSSQGIFSIKPGDISTPKTLDDRGMSGTIADQLQAIIKGGQTRFSPAVLEALKSNLRRSSDAATNRAISANNDEAVALGGRQGALDKEAMDARIAGASQYSAGVQDIMVQKANADFEDRMSALDRGQKWLDNMRQYELGLDQNSIERDRLRASLTLGYARLAQDRDRLEFDRWATLLGREPIEGRDFTYIVGEDGQRHRVFYNDLQYGTQLIGAGA